MFNHRALTPVNLILSVASGVFLFLSFPKFGLSIFAWFSLVPLLYALRTNRLIEGMLTGLITGLVYNIGIIYWVIFVVVGYGHLPIYLGVPVMLLLALYLSVYVSLFSAGVIFFRGRGIPEIISAPLLWTCLEYGKSCLLTGFPWENLAYSQYLNTSLIQIADITGIYGITFLAVFTNCVIYDLISGRAGKGRALLEGVTACILVALVFYYGTFKIDSLKETIKDAKSVEVALIQGNIDQSIKWNPQYQKETLNIYEDLSSGTMQSGQGLVVWPETAVPFFFQNADDRQKDILCLAEKLKSYLLLGSPSYVKENRRASFLNSAYLISPAGAVAGRYDKVHLVPYGEYVPLHSLFPFLDKLVTGVGDFKSGRGYYPLLMDDEKIGVLICFEGIFPEISREYRKNGASLLVNITNDAWFGRSSAPYQHLSMTVFRAVENRLYIARAANTGISAIIGPTGEIISKTELFERTALTGTVKFIDYETFYSKYGDIFIWSCFFLLFLLFLISIFRRRKENDRRFV